MKSFEQKSRNFIVMMLFLVCSVSAAKTLHDYTVIDVEEKTTELNFKE